MQRLNFRALFRLRTLLAVMVSGCCLLPVSGQTPTPTPKATKPDAKKVGAKVTGEANTPFQPTARPTPPPAPKSPVKVLVKATPPPAPPKTTVKGSETKPVMGAAAVKPPTVKPPAKPVAKPKGTGTSQPFTGLAAGKAALKSRSNLVPRVKPVYVKPTIIYATDTVDTQNRVSGIAEDGRFVTVLLNPETRIRKSDTGNELLQPGDLVEGMVLACWGGWDANDPEVYKAKGLVVRRKLDDYQLRMKINDACQKTIRPHSGSPAPAPAPLTPKPATPEPPKPAEPKPTDPKPGEPKPEEPKPADPKPEQPASPPTLV